MEDVMTNGPVVGIIALYEDFLYYKEGVYVHTAGELQGVQAMKIIGWGNDNGTLYWLTANSWNTDWGQNGYCRFLRGVNHCLIEYEMIGAVMKD
ncbi:hypothetical protein OESDEN_24408 [Oesophagostomum dentatum]|uniref:Peptidase C1A papain C-terminal domain-containing protein n=1 Tax=Oesophagostomum dentatum TaxID=61180 RepID=A0A0B1RSB9_OESDE|nr:hypothetical protein OESDEN_24408 [Oesophagostomum dentatum]